MSDSKIREQIIETLKSSKTAVSFNELAETLGITKDVYVLSHNLNQLTLMGIIAEVKVPYGGSIYNYIQQN